MKAVNDLPSLFFCYFFLFNFFFLLIFPNEWLWKAVSISAIAWPLLKQAASGNILVAIIIQNVQKHDSDLYKNCQGWMTKYYSVFSSCLSTSSHENGEFRSSTGAQMLLSLLSTRERQSVINGYSRVSESKIYVMAAMSI